MLMPSIQYDVYKFNDSNNCVFTIRWHVIHTIQYNIMHVTLNDTNWLTSGYVI